MTSSSTPLMQKKLKVTNADPGRVVILNQTRSGFRRLQPAKRVWSARSRDGVRVFA